MIRDFRADEMFVGLVALASIFWIVSILRRGSASGRLPIGRAHVLREERPGPFRLLFGLYVAAAAAMLYIGLDLVIGFDR
jgi:hypothetical protein